MGWIIIIAAMLGLFIAAVVIFNAYKKAEKQAEVTPTTVSDSTPANTLAATSLPEPVTKTSGRIAFESNRDGNLEIYVMNADGSEQTRLTDNPASDSDPHWSGDGRQIVFASNRDGNWQIYVMNADGNDQTRLTNNQSDAAYPAWSPDGQKITFTSNRDGNLEIYVMNADGSHQTRLTNSKGNDSFPDWSADGQKIVFQSTGGGNIKIVGDCEIYIMSAFGSARTSLRSGSGGWGGYYPSWSPDGQKIVFLSNRNQTWGIEVMNTDGSEPTRLTNQEEIGHYPKDYTEDSFPIWSGDGQKIAFASGRDGNSEIYMMNADGSAPINLSNNDAYDSFPDWSPGASTSSLTPAPFVEAEVTQTLISGTPVYPNVACAFHGVAHPSQPSTPAYLSGKTSFYALSCLDKDGWHVYEPDMMDNPSQAPAWLAHLPPRPWPDSLEPLQFPSWMVQCPGGGIYLVLEGRLYLLEGENLLDIQADGYSSVDLLTCGPGNDVWMGLTNTQAEGYGVLTVPGSGQKTSRFSTKVISHFDGSAWTHYPAIEYLGSSEYVDLVKSIAVAPNGNLWIATSESIVMFDGTNWQVFEAGKDFEDKFLPTSLATDSNENVWVVFHYGNDYGLLKYDGVQWSTFWGPKGQPMSGITLDKENRIWVIIGRDTIYSFDPQTNNWTLQYGEEVFKNVSIRAIQFDRQGRIWVNTGYGFYVYDGSVWTAYHMHTADLYKNTADAILVFGDGPQLPALAPKAPGSIHGKLVNPDSAVYTNKRVEICLEYVGVIYYGDTPCTGQSYSEATIVDAEGNFVFTETPVGKYRLLIEVSTNSWVDLGEFEVNPGEKTEFGEILYPPEQQ